MRPAPTASLNEALLAEIFRDLVRQAREHRFDVAPNPSVGAAVLSGERVVARGFHRAWGGPHAEIEALAAAEASGVPRAAWDALVVTLEPCSSQGKTAPCTEAVLASGIQRVVVGARDPDARHEGRGLEQLRAAGVEVELCAWGAPLRDVAPHFLAWTGSERRRRPRPWTIAKWAQTRTGQLVPPAGHGRWISSEASRAEVQVLRGRVDALVTGVGTVLADDPRLTVRPPGDLGHPPLRVVVDSKLRTPEDARLFAPAADGEAAGPVVLLCAVGAPSSRFVALQGSGAEIVSLRPDWHGRLSLREVSRWLWERGLQRVLVEAGPRLLDAYFEEGFVDQVRVYTADVPAGRGPLLRHRPLEGELVGALHRESGRDAVLEGFTRSS